ncbi:hypothetical protein B0A65_05130 [Flavobacterium frigidimaris]|uniref:Uncharacterized protein n=1 Tax=Flavobacterium frigidimaris TaxID=262320 RepID=A0ABX4BUG6_FLAFR|nr:hypothetical protein B0A65_05130 [Flavobacterium frigidimaris]
MRSKTIHKRKLFLWFEYSFWVGLKFYAAKVSSKNLFSKLFLIILNKNSDLYFQNLFTKQNLKPIFCLSLIFKNKSSSKDE